MAKKSKQACDLKSCVLCRESIQSWLPALEANRTCLHFKKGELVFEEGKEVKGMFFIEQGVVKVHKHWQDEKELILRIAGDGDIVGHRGLGNNTIYPVSGTALIASDICFVDLQFFNDTLKVNPDFLYNLMMFFAAELKESEKRMRNLAHMTVKGRVSGAILFLDQKFGTTNGQLNMTLSRQDFAAYVGATYETVFRMLTELNAEGVIRMSGKEITILSENKLKEYSQD